MKIDDSLKHNIGFKLFPVLHSSENIMGDVKMDNYAIQRFMIIDIMAASALRLSFLEPSIPKHFPQIEGFALYLTS